MTINLLVILSEHPNYSVSNLKSSLQLIKNAYAHLAVSSPLERGIKREGHSTWNVTPCSSPMPGSTADADEQGEEQTQGRLGQQLEPKDQMR